MWVEQARKSSERQLSWPLPPSHASSLLREGLCQVPPASHGEPAAGSGERGNPWHQGAWVAVGWLVTGGM